MISPGNVRLAVEMLDRFVKQVGDSPMGGRHLVAREWERAREVILSEMVNREASGPCFDCQQESCGHPDVFCDCHCHSEVG